MVVLKPLPPPPPQTQPQSQFNQSPNRPAPPPPPPASQVAFTHRNEEEKDGISQQLILLLKAEARKLARKVARGVGLG